MSVTGEKPEAGGQSGSVKPPQISLPKGGGAIRGIGEKFAANPVTGTGSMSVPIALSPGRGGFGPQLSITYDSGAGNGLFGLGWHLGLPSITRKTDKGLPRYQDSGESDVFILAGAEDLVPAIDSAGSRLPPTRCRVYGRDYFIRRYRPRIEGLFALIERWTDVSDAANTFWRTISRDNITTWYGRSEDSRIFDPEDPSRIFEWSVCETHDDKGNVANYGYAREDGANVPTTSLSESNRTEAQRTANTYPKRIRYGNVKPYLPGLSTTGSAWAQPEDIADQQWMFEVVFDYGEHAIDVPTTIPTSTWQVRPDPFSSHRAGFEIRTYRLCRRVLMFHHFGELGRADYLVRSTEFTYREPTTLEDALTPGYTVLGAISHWAHQWIEDGANSRYASRQFPPVTLTYSQPKVNQTVQTIAPGQLENLPVGAQGPGYQWIDLDGEGLSGVLAETSGAWYYKANEGYGQFGPLRLVARQPAMVQEAASRHQFMDLAGNGEIDVVDFSGPVPGFHERDRDEGWKRHVPFASLPNIDWQDPNLRFVDLTGDGHADALITEQDVFTWYPSLDARGFDALNRTRQAIDEDAGPRLVFADGTQTVFLADMCGDGLTDLVRVRNGEVCYWPNLGYGRFGRKVTLGNSPCFDHPELYDPRRIRLTDIDGSGPVDLIYLGRDGVRLYFNRSGNSLSSALTVGLPVATENLGAAQVADLLGNGTACLVWNSHLPGDAGHPVRYIDLMGAADESPEEHLQHEKPHLLIGVDNNLGGTTEIQYTPSTRFYLQDKRNGTPWITRLPFPVHCVSRVTVRDKWRGTAFSSTYSYHHGYFDGAEREFRGFGRVEQLDVESYDKSTSNNIGSSWVTDDHTLYQPPVKSVTWYHTGAALDRQRILDQFAHEYFPQRYVGRLPDPVTDPTVFREKPLPEPELPAELTGDEWREALRACKGMVLRQEVYELDVDDLAGEIPRHTPVRLFSAATHNCNIQRLQPRGDNLHAVFLVTESEALTYHYELDLRGTAALQPDPRIAHTLNLRHDEYGNPQQSVAIGYGRVATGQNNHLPRAALIDQVQSEVHIAYSETRYTGDCIRKPSGNGPVKHYRLRLPCEALSYELKGVTKDAGRFYYAMANFRALDLSGQYGHASGEAPPQISIKTIAYHDHADGTVPQKRLVEHVRSLYFDDEDGVAQPAAHKPFSELGPRGLKYEEYKLALTDNLLNAIFGNKLTPDVVSRLDTASISGYVPGTAIAPNLTNQYWMRTGIAGFSSNANQHFYLPEEYTDPFGNLTTLQYDALDLFVQSSEDALGNASGIWLDEATGKPRFDYRVLAPIEMVDANGNHSEVAFDIRGMVIASAVKGKEITAGQWQGDNLEGFGLALANPSPDEVVAFCTAHQADRVQAATWLRNATSRFVYRFGETNDAGGSPQWGQHMPGACGIVREIHAGQPGGATSPLQIALECSDGGGNVMMKKVQAEPDPETGATRWIVNGLTVLNNKGKPVKQYEPAFTPDFGCEVPQANGVSTTTYYDAAGRTVRVEMPDGTYSRIEFSPWLSRSFDANDTVLEPGNAWYAENSATTATSEQRRAASLTAKHANTPSETHFDSLGRAVIAIAHNRTPDSAGVWHDENYLTFTKLDAEGKPLWICDARGNLVMQYVTPAKPNHTPLFDDPNPDWHPAYDMPSSAAPCYDIAGNLLFQHSMDAGDRWMLMDAAGKPMLAWDQNDTGAGSSMQKRLYRTEYDALHRPTGQWLKIDAADPALVEAFEYCDTDQPSGVANLDDAKQRNLIGQAVRHWDPSGLATTEQIDLSGKPAHITRTLILPDADGGTGLLNWSVGNRSSLLEGETFHQISQYDALGRMTTLYNWHRAAPDNRVAVYKPAYNDRGLLLSESLTVRAKKTATGFDTAPDTTSGDAIKEIRYNAKGQKELLRLGNDTKTTYTYDDKTFRLITLRTERSVPPRGLQDLHYTYDAVGNITYINDAAQETVYSNNSIIRPEHHYQYDALYRLIEATGRENPNAPSPPPSKEGPWPLGQFPTGDIPRNYTQSYVYDAVGNFVQMKHLPDTGTGWTRHYSTRADSNRLDQTWYGSNTTDAVTYRYDFHGSMLNLNTTPEDWGLDIQWDWRDMIRGFDCIGGGIARYHYGIDKQRTRKHITRIGGVAEDRIYLGGYELYRRYLPTDLSTPVEEIESLHLFEGEQRVLLVNDVITSSKGTPHTRPDGLTVKAQTLFRYQYSNHLGSACLELDDAAEIISYEEYHPYGTSAYRLMKSGIEAPANLYRYTGMERDEESGLEYHSARYYLPWLGRWASVDPAGFADGTNVFAYCRGSPTRLADPQGRQSKVTDDDVRAVKVSFAVSTWSSLQLASINTMKLTNPVTAFIAEHAHKQFVSAIGVPVVEESEIDRAASSWNPAETAMSQFSLAEDRSGHAIELLEAGKVDEAKHEAAMAGAAYGKHVDALNALVGIARAGAGLVKNLGQAAMKQLSRGLPFSAQRAMTKAVERSAAVMDRYQRMMANFGRGRLNETLYKHMFDNADPKFFGGTTFVKRTLKTGAGDTVYAGPGPREGARFTDAALPTVKDSGRPAVAGLETKAYWNRPHIVDPLLEARTGEAARQLAKEERIFAKTKNDVYWGDRGALSPYVRGEGGTGVATGWPVLIPWRPGWLPN